MDFTLTEEQEMFRKMMRDFATREIAPQASRLDEAEEFPAENWRKISALGIPGLTIPEEYGGSGGGYLQLTIAMEELARACAATSAVLVGTLSLCCAALYRFGNEEQRRRYVTPLARGEKIGCFALTEAEAGSDPASLVTTAERGKDGYVLNGTKVFITNGAEADTIVVFATTDRSLGYRGICAFLVEKGYPGYSVGKKERKLGIRACSAAELVFQDCRVPVSNLLGEEGKGLRQALEIIDGSRISIAAQAVGIAQAALEDSIRYAKERKQFGQPIAQFQAIQWMLADMATAVESARLLTQRAAFFKDRGLSYIKEAAMAKLFASETAMNATVKAIQIHGGYGYIKDYPLERYFRDAKITEIYEGTSEMQRLTIARRILAD